MLIKDSFTRAPIHALESLVQERDGRFTAIGLRIRIKKDTTHFSKAKIPCLSAVRTCRQLVVPYCTHSTEKVQVMK